MPDRSVSFSAHERRGWLDGGDVHPLGGPAQAPYPAGVEWLDLEGGLAPAVFVPSTLPAGPVPVMVLLHGATSNPLHALRLVQDEAERRQFVVVAPKSVGTTRDVIHGGFGPDVAALDLVLAAVFDHVAADPRRLAIAGFSDGASYALTLGLANGALCPSILAFSPGFFVPARRQGWPAIFVSHGVSAHEDTAAPARRLAIRGCGAATPRHRDADEDDEHRHGRRPA